MVEASPRARTKWIVAGRLAFGALLIWVSIAQLARFDVLVGELAVSWSAHAGIVLAAVASVLAWKRRIAWAVAAAAGAALGLAPWVPTWSESRAPVGSAGDFAVLAANPYWGNEAVPELVAAIGESSASLVALIEPPDTLASALATTGRWSVVAEHVGHEKFNIAVVVATGEERGLTVDAARVLTFGWAESAIIECRLSLRGQPFRFYAVHGPAPTTGPQFLERGRLVETLVSLLRSSEAPAVLAGDLNATMASPVWRRLIDEGGLRRPSGPTPRTWPSVLGPLGITLDHVLVDGGWSASPAQLLELPDSDHLGVRVWLTLEASAPPSQAKTPEP